MPDVRRNNSGQRSGASRHHLGAYPSKAPQARPSRNLSMYPCYTQSLLIASQSRPCILEFLSRYRFISYVVYSPLSHQLAHSQTRSSLPYSHPFFLRVCVYIFNTLTPKSSLNLIYDFIYSFKNNNLTNLDGKNNVYGSMSILKKSN